VPKDFLAWCSARIEAMPESLRPAAFGAGIVLFMTLSRAGMIVGPILVAIVLFQSETPGADLLLGVKVLLLATLGGALGGLAYGVVGRRLRFAFPGGRYLAGIVAVMPYTFVLGYLVGLLDDERKPLWRLLDRQELGISVFLGVLFGLVVGHSWFAPDGGDDSDASESSAA
jgi:hypothetical protein